MAKKEKIVKKVETKNIDKEVSVAEEVVVSDDSLKLDIENSPLLEANVGSFEEEIMSETKEVMIEDVKEEETVQEEAVTVVVEDVKEEEVVEKNNPHIFKRMFGYIWNGQVCGE